MNGDVKKSWLAPAATLLSLVACYGTLAAVAVLGALGIGIALNETVWAGAIVFFAVLAELVLLVRWRRHRRPLPVSLAGLGVVIIVLTMFASYHLVAEIAGFLFLCAGTFLDWRVPRSPTGRGV
mgnify:CR=1 FL=1